MSELIRFQQMNQKPVDCVPERRILRNVVIASTGLASDGAIILPAGMVLERYLKNPIVTDRHVATAAPGENPEVIARTLSISISNLEVTADELQFADTEAGREFAYLYGVNDDRQAYMRAWSVEGVSLEETPVTWPDAQKLSGPYWDADLAVRLQRKIKKVLVAIRFELAGLAAVTLGADRAALTRAAGTGVKTAGKILARMDLDSAHAELEDLKLRLDESDARITRLETDIQALRGEGASAAAQGDSEALLNAVRDLRRVLTGERSRGQ